MGPHCNYCGRRCFVHITAEWPTHIQAAYNEHFGHTHVIAATCPDGQAVEKRLIGWCYDDARAQMDPMFSAARLVLQKIIREHGALEEMLRKKDYTREELQAANRIIRGATMNLLGAIEELIGEIPAAPINHQHTEVANGV